jgi:long-chain acyl-CoA synthetase
MTECGALELVGRTKEMINVAGRKVYPREVEDVLYAHADVMEAVVVGVPDGLRGETVKAFVALRDGATADAPAVIAHCRASLAPYKVPRVVEFRERLPRSTVGKLLRRLLADDEHARAGEQSLQSVWAAAPPSIAP